MNRPKILFILKKRDNLWGENDGYSYCGGFSSGLYNSANFVCEMLIKNEFESKLVEVIDANFIDREVFHYRPTHVILEAIFVPPSKFIELTKLHPKVKFIIRNHSEVPFLSTEGNGFDWLLKYTKFKNVFISNNSENINEDFVKLIEISQELSRAEAQEKVIYLPNYYWPGNKMKKIDYAADEINIGCFGACRILKNPVIQAVAAIEFAAKINKKLRFHINGTRVEGGGAPVLKTLQTLFGHFKNCKLIEHPWRPHPEFLALIDKMDVGMQVSFSESFNIIAANFVDRGVPIVVSPEIKWADPLSHIHPTKTDFIVQKLNSVYHDDYIVRLNKSLLRKYSEKSEKLWINFLTEE